MLPTVESFASPRRRRNAWRLENRCTDLSELLDDSGLTKTAARNIDQEHEFPVQRDGDERSSLR
jgi:hypothetical protein